MRSQILMGAREMSLVVGGILLLLVAPSRAVEVTSIAEPPRVAELETSGGDRILVREGDVIPGLGEVTSIEDETVTIERAIGEAEREDRKRRGVFAPDFEQRIYPRHDSAGVIGFGSRN